MTVLRASIGELANRGALTFGDGYRTKRSEHGKPGFRILRVGDIAAGSVSRDGADYVSIEQRSKIGDKLAEPGDIVLTTKGTVGRVATVPVGIDPAVYSPQVCYFRVRDLNVLLPRFLELWLRSDDFVVQASVRANNTDMAAYINLADIRSVSVPLPPIREQRAIAEVLGALDDKIAANSALVETSDRLAATLTRAALDRHLVSLSAIADIVMGSSPPGTSYNESGDGVVFYQGVRDFGIRTPSNRVWTTDPVRLAESADTLVSVRAPVGRTNLAAERTCIGRGLAAVRSRDGRPMTLFHVLRDSPAVWAPYESEGTVFGSITKRQLADVKIGSVDERRAAILEHQLTSIEHRIACALQEDKGLTATRDALLPGLMSGKIRVKDAEKIVEEVV